MKTLFFSIAFFMSANIFSQTSFYDFKVEDINGNIFDFASLKGKKVMIVNTASKCGFTPQYADLEKLYKEFKSYGFIIIAFPSNDFKNQEPLSNEEIKQFCTLNFGVTFPVMSKISVKGENMHPIYKWLTRKELNGVRDSEVTWNFQKYLIDRDGTLYDIIKPSQSPYSQNVIDWIKQ